MNDRAGELMTTGEVASLCRVNPKTVARWASEGRLTSVRTVGGHRRFYRAEVNDLLEASKQPRRGREAG